MLWSKKYICLPNVVLRKSIKEWKMEILRYKYLKSVLRDSYWVKVLGYIPSLHFVIENKSHNLLDIAVTWCHFLKTSCRVSCLESHYTDHRKLAHSHCLTSMLNSHHHTNHYHILLMKEYNKNNKRTQVVKCSRLCDLFIWMWIMSVILRLSVGMCCLFADWPAFQIS